MIVSPFLKKLLPFKTPFFQGINFPGGLFGVGKEPFPKAGGSILPFLLSPFGQ